MARITLFILALLYGIFVCAQAPIVVDGISCTGLSGASVFDRTGTFAGTTTRDGRIACVADEDYPVTIRYMGYRECVVPAPCDTVFMEELITELAEVVVESRQKKVLHVLAYVREYSTLSTFTDTVSMFREKMVDFMLPDEKTRFRGWRRPRILNSKSYYRFSNADGIDSVSDRCNHHFTWSDWIELPGNTPLPPALAEQDATTDTVWGKYSPAEIWNRRDDRVTLDVNVMADARSRRWVANIYSYFKDNVEFEQFRLRYTYNNVADDSVTPLDLTGFSFNIESTGRGHGMFRFNRVDESYYVTTYTEVYILDKEFIPVSEAKKWEKNKPRGDEIGIYPPPQAPPLQDDVERLVARVEAIRHDEVRTALEADRRLAGANTYRHTFGSEVFKRIKQMFGIDYLVGEKKQARRWDNFRKGQVRKNQRNGVAR